MKRRGLGKKTALAREIIAERYADGYSLRQIAAEMGWTPPAVLYHLKAMGIARRPAVYHGSATA